MRLTSTDALVVWLSGVIEAMDPCNNDRAQGLVDGLKAVLEVIESAEPIEAEPVKHGRWLPYMEEMDNGFGETYLVQTGLQCSERGAYGCCGGNFCKNCGAKMDLEEKKDDV